jgi:hypothetical protein
MSIYEEIEAERERQRQMWKYDQRHRPHDWLAILIRELSQAAWQDNYYPYRTALVKTAAVCVAAIESIDASVWGSR